MAVTKSWESKVLATRAKGAAAAGRVGWREFAWLAVSSVMVARRIVDGLFGQDAEFPELSAALARGELLDLNQVSKPEQLLPFLQVFPG